MPSYPLSGYTVGGGQSSGVSGTGGGDTKSKNGYWSLDKLKRAYKDYIGTKREEIDEQKDSLRIVHGSQWTSTEINQLNARRQPVTTNNQIARKINATIGTLERLRQDPKAYPRTPKQEQGADLATACIRYAFESQNWQAKDPICSLSAAILGIGVLEFNIIEGDHGDKEIGIEPVVLDSFFYDPRSYLADFSDARYMGVGKWMDLDAAIELYPEYEQELEDSVELGSELTTEADREFKWFQSNNNTKRVRVVDHWYKSKGQWKYAVYTGSTLLMEGDSYLVDEKGQSQCKYEPFSCYIDQDGDRYGLVRNLKPLQRQINMRESKALYTMLSRRIILEKGAVDDVEVTRREAARPDGVIVKNPGDLTLEFDDAARMAETEAQFKFLENVKRDFESFGPNISLLGQGLENASGRAIHLLQQAGLAELGPFLESYKGWKIRCYRKMWNAIQRHWTGERWVRVTDDDDLTQFIQVNGLSIDPATGMPTILNALGSLDVDIILDEGPDAVNLMADAYDTLTALVQGGTQIPPQVLLELAPIPLDVKKKVQEMMNPSSPEAQAKQQMQDQLTMQKMQADVQQVFADAHLKEAQAQKAIVEANTPPDQPMGAPGEHPAKIEAEVAHKAAQIEKTRMETAKIQQDMQLAPVQMQMEREDKVRQQEMADRAQQHKERESGAKLAIQLDGSIADQVNNSAKQYGDNISALGQALVDAANKNADALAKATDAMAGASEAMAGAAQEMVKAVKSPKRIVRDPKTGRAAGVETY